MDGKTFTTCARRVTMPVFKVGLATFLLLGVALVVLQAVGLIIADPGLVSGASSYAGKAMTIIAAVTGILGFVMSYVFPWQRGED